MSQVERLSDKLWRRVLEKGPYYLVWCPACKCGHGIPCWPGAGTNNPDGPGWSFNDNVASPTFTPSVRITSPGGPYCCHFNVIAGSIHYCGDCSHEMSGLVVEMQPIPRDYGL